MLSATDVFGDSGRNAPRWVIAAMGSAFVLALLMSIVQGTTGWMSSAEQATEPPGRALLLTHLLLGVPLLLCFAAAPNWIAFGHGIQTGSGSVGIAGLSVPVETGKTAAHAVWVVSALALDAFIIAFVVVTLRRLRSAMSDPI
jgi:hypothetical protein